MAYALETIRRLLRKWTINLALCVAPISSGAADYTEITVQLNSTWQSPSVTNHHQLIATCIVGSNDWFFSGDFLKNASLEYWLVGTNIIEQTTITSSMYLEQAKEFVSEKILGQNPRSPIAHNYPRAGEKFATIHPSPSGRPVLQAMGGVVWLAYCSGDYLKQPGRQIPMPIGPSSRAFGYADKTTLFDERGGLPKTVKLFAKNGTLACAYEVIATTNYLGRTFPVQFRVMQRGQPADVSVSSSSWTDLEGKLISIKSGKRREIPDEVRRKLETPRINSP